MASRAAQSLTSVPPLSRWPPNNYSWATKMDISKTLSIMLPQSFARIRGCKNGETKTGMRLLRNSRRRRMACKGVFECSQSSHRLMLSRRFQWVSYQLEVLRQCSSHSTLPKRGRTDQDYRTRIGRGARGSGKTQEKWHCQPVPIWCPLSAAMGLGSFSSRTPL
jgi:hypothetical protein